MRLDTVAVILETTVEYVEFKHRYNGEVRIENYY